MGTDLESSLTLKSKEGKVFLETVNMTFEQMCAMCGVPGSMWESSHGAWGGSGCGKGPYVGYL